MTRNVPQPLAAQVRRTRKLLKRPSSGFATGTAPGRCGSTGHRPPGTTLWATSSPLQPVGGGEARAGRPTSGSYTARPPRVAIQWSGGPPSIRSFTARCGSPFGVAVDAQGAVELAVAHQALVGAEPDEGARRRRPRSRPGGQAVVHEPAERRLPVSKRTTPSSVAIQSVAPSAASSLTWRRREDAPALAHWWTNSSPAPIRTPSRGSAATGGVRARPSAPAMRATRPRARAPHGEASDGELLHLEPASRLRPGPPSPRARCGVRPRGSCSLG